MDIKNAELVNCGNDYYPGCFNEVCARLESGMTVHLYIDCIGHTRNNIVQEVYQEKLQEKYGENLTVEKSGGGLSYSYLYCLKAN